ncbi:MAG: GNAT family N-acetyltransferase [Arenicellales bacterium]|nr:GNAT family N-acetyltransferase [Arenicellales bacterium]
MSWNIQMCSATEHHAIGLAINDASKAYRGVIPADCWKSPYMTAAELEAEIADGVLFWGLSIRGELVGVMGLQHRDGVDLIRHSYVCRPWQGKGIGCALLAEVELYSKTQILVGTWAQATWAIGFYQANGYRLLDNNKKSELLDQYWQIPTRQAQASVVLAKNLLR